MSTVIYPSPVFGPIRSRRLGVSLGINLSSGMVSFVLLIVFIVNVDITKIIVLIRNYLHVKK